jgi:ABC-type multidrug transport system fused ATPase/permease subunit
LEVPQEKAPVIDEKRPPAYWPSSVGGLVVDNLVVRYAPDLPPVLNGISFTVNPREKIGVVGRTGAGMLLLDLRGTLIHRALFHTGKSTLALSLLRIIEPSDGKIM